MISNSTLDNGLQIVTESMEDVGSVALSFLVATGSRDESIDEWGMSHFLEHLLFKGSKTRNALDVAEAIDGVGGDMNAFTTKECTAFYVRVLAEDAEEALDILCDIMCDPAFDPKEVEAERQVVLEEILMRNDDPGDLAQELLSEKMFAGHTLGREILGSEEGIRSMKASAIQEFFEHHYRPRNLVFAAAGKLDHQQMVDGVARRWHGREGGARPQRTAPVLTTGVNATLKKPTDQAHLMLGVPAPDRHQPERYVMALLDTILGGGMSSRLFQEIREKRGLAYTVYSSYGSYDDAGELGIYLGTAPRRAAEAIEVVLDQLSIFKEKGVTEQEFVRAKRHLRTTSALGLEDSGARMSRIGRSLLLHGDVLTIDEVMQRINAVTIDDIGAMAQQIFSAEPVIVAVGPVKETDLPVRSQKLVNPQELVNPQGPVNPQGQVA